MSLHIPVPPTLRDVDALRKLGVWRVLAQALVTGGVVGAVIGLFRAAYDALCAFSLRALLAHDMHEPLAIFGLFGALFLLAMMSLLLLRREPLISGSGIPQVELMVHGHMRMRWLRVLLCKFTGTLISLTGGLSVGREGPSIMMGAAVGSGVGRFWHRKNADDLPRFLVGGSVAGMTAAFGAPLAGMFFAFEEMKTLLSAPMFLFTGACALAAWFVVDCLLGFGLVFPFAAQPFLHWQQFWLPLVAGVCMGILGCLYNETLMRLTLWEDRCPALPQPLRVLLPFMLTGCLVYAYPQVLPGIGIATLHLESLPLPLTSLLTLLAVKLLFSCLSFASGVSGGILMPLLHMGALGGACLASACTLLHVLDPDQTGTMLTLCMAGMFAAAVRAPLTATALLLEMTGAFHNAPAVLLTAYVAVFTANVMGSQPIYDSLRTRCLVGLRSSPTHESAVHS
ncbi:MAG: chloride channel protein [Desulfovibrio sp.]|nr:chloride channel protein [Desulfovibrio sp.]